MPRQPLLEGNPGTDPVPSLVPNEDEFQIVKRRYSGFIGTEFRRTASLDAMEYLQAGAVRTTEQMVAAFVALTEKSPEIPVGTLLEVAR